MASDRHHAAASAGRFPACPATPTSSPVSCSTVSTDETASSSVTTKKKKKMSGKYQEHGYLTESDTKIGCVHCGKEYTWHSSLTTFAYHLRKTHSIDVTVMPDSDKGRRQPTLETLTGLKPAVARSRCSQMTETQKKLLLEATATWVAGHARPLHIVQDEFFMNLMRVATGHQNYKPPCYATLSKEIDRLFTEHEQHLRRKLCAASAVALTADFWTSSHQNLSYLGLTAHFVDSEWNLCSSTLDIIEVPESHTAEVCGRRLQEVCNTWNIGSKVVAVVTDRGRNILKGVTDYTEYTSLTCMAHVLHRAIEQGFLAAQVENLLSKCRKLVGHFKHSPLATAILKSICEDEEMKNLTMVQDVTTRWYSALFMLQRLLSQKQAIMVYLESNSNKFSFTLSEQDFARMEKLVAFLKPFQEVSEFLGGEKYTTISNLCRARRKIEMVLLEEDEDDPAYIVRFKRKIQAYLCDLPLPSIVKEAAAIDPRFTHLKGIPEKDTIYKEVKKLAVDLAQIKEPVAIEVDLAAVESSSEEEDIELHAEFNGGVKAVVGVEWNRYFCQKRQPLASDPLQFWKENADVLPHLAPVANRLLLEFIFNWNGGC